MNYKIIKYRKILPITLSF